LFWAKIIAMKKVILIFGIIAGSIVSAMMFITMPMYDEGILNFDNGEIVGYTTMVIALSMVFFGIKSYRDNHADGAITFGQGFKVGILITLIACIMYVISWEICYHTIASDFSDKYSEYYIEKVKKKGGDEASVREATEYVNSFKEMYKNPFVRMGFTFLEIFPVGLVVTLISSALLRKKQFLPSS
jgi:hypothetical protein